MPKKRTFMIGNRVIFIDRNFGQDSSSRPLWGGKYGHIVGKVTDIGRSEGLQTCIIEWENDHTTELKSKRLARYNPLFHGPAKLLAKNRLKVGGAGLKHIAAITILVVVADHFLLNGKFRNKLVNMVNGGFDRVKATLSKEDKQDG